MTHEETSLKTKQAICNSLKEIMRQKPFSKITVSEIIADCNVNRKTFYYHFEDIYDLLKWILEEEAIEVVKKFDLLVDYQEALSFVIDYVEANKHIINCAYDSLGREGMKHFLYADFAGIVWMLIEGFEEQLDVHVNESFKKFLCEFYTEALSGMLINWFRDKGSSGKAVRDREQVIQDILLIFSSSLPNILKTYHAEKQI